MLNKTSLTRSYLTSLTLASAHPSGALFDASIYSNGCLLPVGFLKVTLFLQKISIGPLKSTTWRRQTSCKYCIPKLDSSKYLSAKDNQFYCRMKCSKNTQHKGGEKKVHYFKKQTFSSVSFFYVSFFSISKVLFSICSSFF